MLPAALVRCARNTHTAVVHCRFTGLDARTQHALLPKFSLEVGFGILTTEYDNTAAFTIAGSHSFAREYFL